ncbi:MAG: replication initiation factor domain-containing protein [Pseudomonadota bacterium]
MTPTDTTLASVDADEHAARKDEHGARSGGDMPRLVIRGETNDHHETANPNIALIDWLAFSVLPPESVDSLPWIAKSLEILFGIPPEQWNSTDKGWQGYARRVDLGDYGLLAYGGERQRGTVHVSLNAKACARVQDWNAIRVWGDTYDAHICRVDLAHDDFQGSFITVDRAIQWYREGGFALNGRPSAGHHRDDLGSGEGRTFYVGKRENGKLCRVYEKGKQLGDPLSPWVRAEVELRNKSRLIPWEVLTRAGAYLAGAYPCFATLSTEQSKIKTVQRIYEMTYTQMCGWVKSAAGRALNVMCEVERGDSAAVLSQVMREGQPKRLMTVPCPDDFIGKVST